MGDLRTNLSTWTMAELDSQFRISEDEDEITALEHELERRIGFPDSTFSPGQRTHPVNTYTFRTPEEDAALFRKSDFYIPDLEGSTTLDSELCDTCAHINFRHILTHFIPQREFTLGPLEEIIKRTGCALCRLITATIRLVMIPEELQRTTPGISVEVGLFNLMKDDEGTLYDIAIALFPLNMGMHNVVRIQELSTLAHDHMFRGRILGGSGISFELVKQWLYECENSDACDARTDDFCVDEPFCPSYLIDVKTSCVVMPDIGQIRYLALSYVWGGPQPVQLLLGTKDRLMTPGGLRSADHALPKTIDDAMLLTRNLGERYLWVDALCIVQDDFALKEPELRTMDRIYQYALLTIIAGHGADANAGLPGVRPGTRSLVQHVETVQGIQLVNRLPTSQATIDCSIWNSRAWTYQERLLARRKLMVSEYQVSFTCEHTEVELSEDVHGRPILPSQRAWHEGELRNQVWQLHPTCLNDLAPVGSINTAIYTSIVQQFTKRNISFATDVLNAFLGVVQRLKPLFGGAFLLGLPANELDTQLLWQPVGPVVRRRTPDGKTAFPSWSWAGWLGPVTGRIAGWDSLPEIELMDIASQAWFTMDQRRGVDPTAPESRWWRLEYNNAWFWQYGDGTDMFYAHPLVLDRVAKRRHLLPRLLRNAQGVAEILPLRAQVVSFDITGTTNPLASAYLDMDPNQPSGLRALCLYSADHSHAGTVFVPTSVAASLLPGTYEFIRISTTRSDPGESGSEPTMLMAFGSCFDQGRFPSTGSGRDQVDGLLVKRGEDDVAYRLGAGRCHVTAFEEALPTRKIVHLG
jgi:hypothetical protein